MPSGECDRCGRYHRTQQEVQDCFYSVSPLTAVPVSVARSQSTPVQVSRTGTPIVPKGRYGLRHDESGEIHYFKVSIMRGSGLPYITRLMDRGKGYSNLGEQTLREKSMRDAILRCIASDVVAAAQEFGKKWVVCGFCGRELTDLLSRSRKIGPICWDKYCVRK